MTPFWNYDPQLYYGDLYSLKLQIWRGHRSSGAVSIKYKIKSIGVTRVTCPTCVIFGNILELRDPLISLYLYLASIIITH